ncbi:MAG: cyclic nucleotide-binding domain-containing protein [Actinomycetota bacterium]
MARDKYIQHLREVPLFSKLSKKELNEIARLSTELTFKDGKELMKEGARANSFLVIVEGEAVVRKKGRKVATLGPGDFAGELALLQNRDRNATVVASGELTALVVDRRGFQTLLDDIPAVTKKMLTAVAERLGDMDSKAVH